MSAPYQLHADPELEAPVLLMALDGWIDAGFGSTHAVATLLSSIDTYPIATFDSDELLDHRARRPIMTLVDGVNTGLTWPAIELRGGTDLAGNDVLLLVGAEPDHAWRSFSSTVIDLATRFGTRIIIGLGAYPAAVPHTRATLLSCTAATEELAGRWNFLRGTLEVPAGVHAAIERAAADAGLPAIGVWAQVPHYTAGMAYPAASLALIESAAAVGGLSLPTGNLPEEAREARERLDEIIAGNEEHARMVAALESETDAHAPGEQFGDGASPGPLPTGAELVAELEQFLREQGPDS